MTQEARVKMVLEKQGYIDNFYCLDLPIRERILRLGAIMCDLKKQGVQFYSKSGREMGKPESLWKNQYYVLVRNGQNPL